MPPWLELAVPIGLALILAYVVADLAARVIESSLKAILPPESDRRFITRPKLIIRLVIFAIAAVAFSIPALRLVGMEVGRSPGELGRAFFEGGLKIAGIAIGAYAVIRVGSAAGRRFEHELSTGSGFDAFERAKRAQTLNRLLQNTLTVLVIGTAGLMILGELNINIAPVLTGAGIVGLAVGFGAQTLVRDIISGFFLILEDQVRVGDVAVVNGQSGLVEAVNLRTIVLRDEEGTVHVIPNGEVKTLSNRSKDFSYYVIAIAIPQDESPDRIAEAMQRTAATLMTDPAFNTDILAPLEVYGVDDFRAGQLVLKARIKTVPLKQWRIGRELRKRLAATFKDTGIELPGPSMSVKVEGLDALLAARTAEPRS
jgi:small conductance mechanosensitive channel